MEAVLEAKKIIENKESKENYGPLYLFTNENLNVVTKKIDLKNKKIVTTCASGDQYFNFTLQNPSEVKLYDINELTKYLLYLKNAAILNLDFEEFKYFLLTRGLFKNYLLDKSFYKRIKEDMPDYVEYLWNQLFKAYSSKELYNSNLFFDNKKNAKEIINNNNYLQNEENYLLLKSKLKKIQEFEFYNINIFKSFIEVENYFDLIYLSNIIYNIPANNKKEYLEELRQIFNNISRSLTENGKIVLCYIFLYLEENWENNDNYIKKIVQESIITKKKELFKYTLIELPGGLTYKSTRQKDKDALILCKKDTHFNIK